MNTASERASERDRERERERGKSSFINLSKSYLPSNKNESFSIKSIIYY